MDPGKGKGLSIRVMNPTAKDIVLRIGTAVGHLHQVRVFASLFPDESGNRAVEIKAVSTAQPCAGSEHSSLASVPAKLVLQFHLEHG